MQGVPGAPKSQRFGGCANTAIEKRLFIVPKVDIENTNEIAENGTYADIETKLKSVIHPLLADAPPTLADVYT